MTLVGPALPYEMLGWQAQSPDFLRKSTDAERKADDGPVRLVHLSIGSDKSALPVARPNWKAGARKRACSVWSGGKAAKPSLSLPYPYGTASHPHPARH